MGFRLFVSHSTPRTQLPRLGAIVAAIKGAAGDDRVDVISTGSRSSPMTTAANACPRAGGVGTFLARADQRVLRDRRTLDRADLADLISETRGSWMPMSRR
jgi:hypothetical protein